MKTLGLASWSAVALGLGCAQAPSSYPIASVPIEYLPQDSLILPTPGWALVTDSARWQHLWRLYAAEYDTEDGVISTAVAPAVDFQKEEILVVYYGVQSGCGDEPPAVVAVDEWTDHLAATFRHADEDGFVVVCQMLIHPVDLVRLPHIAKPVRFPIAPEDSGRYLPPPQAPDWWVTPDVKAITKPDTTPRGQVRTIASHHALPRDTTLPLSTYRQIARYAYEHRDPQLLRLLLQNPRAAHDMAVMAWLSSDWEGEGARQRILTLLDRHGLAIARDSHSALPWLEALMYAMTFDEVWTSDQPYYPLVATALARNPVIQNSVRAASRLTYAVGMYPSPHREACLKYLRRFPRDSVLTDSLGKPGEWVTPACSDFPDPKRSH